MKLFQLSLIGVAFLALNTTVADCVTESGDETVNSHGLMKPGELEALPSKPPDRRIAYDTHLSQYGELRVPTGSGPHPIAILIHGGCFKAAYASLRDLSPMADALKQMGIATWNIEYRRLGQDGGGWPGTYLDVGRAADHLRTIAPEFALDLSRVIVVGHLPGPST